MEYIRFEDYMDNKLPNWTKKIDLEKIDELRETYKQYLNRKAQLEHTQKGIVENPDKKEYYETMCNQIKKIIDKLGKEIQTGIEELKNSPNKPEDVISYAKLEEEIARLKAKKIEYDNNLKRVQQEFEANIDKKRTK